MTATVPDYSWFAASAPEGAFGCSAERYLPVSRDEARSILAALPEEGAMADMLFAQGHLGEEQFGMADRRWALPDEVTPEDVRQTIGALLRSFGPSHEVKIATVAVALHRWFPKTQEQAA